MEGFVREVVVTPTFWLLPVDENRVQAWKLACRTGDTRRRIYVQNKRAESLPDSFFEQLRGNLAEIPLSSKRFGGGAHLLECASFRQRQAHLKRTRKFFFSLPEVSKCRDPSSRARLEFVQQPGRCILGAPRETTFSDQTKAIGKVFEIHAEYLHRSHQLFGRELALPCFNRCERLTVFKTELFGKLSLREPSFVACYLEATAN